MNKENTLATYSSGINWCHFQVKIDDEVVSFRLHMEESECWELLKYLDKEIDENLRPMKNSGITFTYGSDKIVEESLIDKKECRGYLEMPNDKWQWLENVFLQSSRRTIFSGSRCKYHGVILYKNKN